VDLTDAVREYLAALDQSRREYVPTARNSPNPRDVATARRQRLTDTEQQLRDCVQEVSR
jgi:hypothetical protein